MFRQERNEEKRKKVLVDDNHNYRGRDMSQMSASDSIFGQTLNFSAEDQDAVDAVAGLHAESTTGVKRPLGRRELPTRKVAAVAKASEETKNEIKARASKRLEINTTKQQCAAVVAAKPRTRAKTAKHPNKAVEGNAGNDKVTKSKKTKATAADRSPKRKKVAAVVNSPTPSMQLRSRNQERKEDKERAHQLKKKQQQTEKKFVELMEESSESTGGSTSS